MVVSPHPDDETLGAGGSLFRYKKEGHKIYWLNITDIDEMSGWPKEIADKRKQQIKQINELYGFDGFYNLGFTPTTLGDISENELISAISKCIHEVEPQVLLLPNPYDAHSDHKYVFNATMACTKVFRYPYIKKILTMEILSETDFGSLYHSFEANYYVDITDYIEDKIDALKIYDTEIGEPPFPRSIDAVKSLATLRGGAAGVRYSEAFHVIKVIE